MSGKLFASPQQQEKISSSEPKNKVGYISEAGYFKLKNRVKSAGEWTFYIGGVGQLILFVLFLFLGMNLLNGAIFLLIAFTFLFLGWNIQKLNSKKIDATMYGATLATAMLVILSAISKQSFGILAWIMLFKQISGCAAVSKLMKIQEFKDSLK